MGCTGRHFRISYSDESLLWPGGMPSQEVAAILYLHGEAVLLGRYNFGGNGPSAEESGWMECQADHGAV